MAKASKPPPKKTSAKKAAPGKELKYTDKSPGQPGLRVIFGEISKLLLPYEKGTIQLQGGTGGKIMLISKKEVEIAGRKRNEIWFVSALVQKGYVGLYYMPVYMNPVVRRQLAPELLRCLKGKACFHIKKTDPQLLAQIKEALEIGYESYKKLGWV